MNQKHTRPLFKISLLSLAVASSMAYSQEATVDEVVVTGYKASLQNATNAKRESTSLVESVFAEDIGKFADTNIAEAINRMPGIQISRDVFGDGTNVSIRGLGTSFTKVTLNSSQIAVASAGSVDSQNQNREIDLNLFPTELFTRFDVQKTPIAGQLEGGVAGVVNIRAARPFDNKESGFNSIVNVQGVYTDINSKTSPKLSAMGSWTNDTFGVLGGVSIYNKHLTTEGFETIGWTNLNTSHKLCGTTPSTAPGSVETLATTGGCNPLGGNGWNVAGLDQTTTSPNFGNGVVPVGAGAGLVAGTVIDQKFLLDNNPGLNITQISDALIPRLGRPAYMDGTQDRVTGLVSFEYRPSDEMQYYFDVISTSQDKDFNRLDLDFVGRNGTAIPLNMKVNSDNVVTSATFANAQFFLEARPYTEALDFYNLNPGAHFEFADIHQIDVQLNSSRSDWKREAPTILVNTPANAGLYVDYSNAGDVPSYAAKIGDTAVNFNDPNLGWTWAGGRVNIQNEKRKTKTDGAHIDYRIGDDANNFKLGLATDGIRREIRGYDNTSRWEDIVCRDGLDANGNSPATAVRKPCNGLNPNSKIPQSALASYLKPGPYGFVSVDYDRFKAATQYAELSASAPEGNIATGANSGIVDEDTQGAYIELNTSTEIAGRTAKLNIGTRYATTDQLISGPVTVNGVRQWVDLKSKYDALLPSFNTTYEIAEDVILRFSTSRSLTRADPSAMLPAISFGDVSAQNASVGNPNLSPYLSTNIDFGGEWYTGDEGYVGATLFKKQITGFTVNGTNSYVFSKTGIPWDLLSQDQKNAINSRGGPDAAKITVQQQVNASGNLEIEGSEFTWVQPLNMVVTGLGINANYTRIHQRSEGPGLPAQAIGVSPSTYNFTTYWENYGASVRLTYVWNDKQLSSGPGQQNISIAQLKTDARGQLDLSTSYDFENVLGEPQITFNISNLTGESQRQTFQYESATYTFYDPGPTATLGVRASF
ncbi:MAG TPA: TonB-dependent receptor [Cellvibrionaceae bacterium]